MSIREIGSNTLHIIFRHPLSASAFVGTLMHGVNSLSEFLTHAQSPMYKWAEAFSAEPVFTSIHFSIPYLVAGLAIKSSQYASRRHGPTNEISQPVQPGPRRRRLDLISKQLSGMIDLIDTAFSQYDPRSFDVTRHDQLMFRSLLSMEQSPPESSPSHLFHVNWLEDRVSGYVYYLEEGEVFRSMSPIEIPIEHNHYAIFSGSRDVVLENWEDTGDSLAAFQNRFHPTVRRIVGTIERYVTYRSGDIAVIAFYRGRKLDSHDAILLKGLTTFSQSMHRIAMESQETEHAFRYLVDALARASEVNDEDTGAHIVRINEYSKALASRLGMDKTFIDTIYYSAQMHDVGKIHIHPDILKKPGALSSEEYEQMKAHCTYGAHILGDSPRLKMAREIAQHHHEKFNGRGYPNGLRGKAIPLSARIVALADVYDALRQPRVYKEAFSHAKTMNIITRGDGRTRPDDFDPDLLKAFVAIEAELDSIYQANPG